MRALSSLRLTVRPGKKGLIYGKFWSKTIYVSRALRDGKKAVGRIDDGEDDGGVQKKK